MWRAESRHMWNKGETREETKDETGERDKADSLESVTVVARRDIARSCPTKGKGAEAKVKASKEIVSTVDNLDAAQTVDGSQGMAKGAK